MNTDYRYQLESKRLTGHHVMSRIRRTLTSVTFFWVKCRFLLHPKAHPASSAPCGRLA